MIELKDGTEIVVKILEWYEESWEFDRPTLVLFPVIRYSPNGKSVEYMAEDLGINLCVEGKAENHDYTSELEWRGWKLDYLNKVYSQVRKGKKFPKKRYKATEYRLRFFTSADSGQLDVVMVEV